MDLQNIFGLSGKNVFITGAGSGMGKAAARLLVSLGAKVYATTRRKPLDFTVEKEIKVADLGQPDELENLMKELPDELEAIFLCHGIANAPGNTNALQVNLTNFFSFKVLTEGLLPRITDGGSVTFISSDGGQHWRKNIAACQEVIACKSWKEAVTWYEAHPEKTNGGYVFSKECQHVYVMSKVWAPEFIDRKIRLNCISPGMTKTGLNDDFNRAVMADGCDPAVGQTILEKYFLSPWNGHWAAPEEMGYPMVVLGSRICSYISGQIVYIDYGTASVNEFKNLTDNL
ncbi:MAG: SDR family oxidoreductase [Clostridiales bacterium]|nr:SDR family oxidoreductase [Clostridiales bacterium]